MYEHLFSPMKIGAMELKNRIIMPAMGTRMADEKSQITPKLIGYHRARAAGGSGLNIVEVSSVHTKSAPAHFVSISDDQYIEGHRQLCEAIHEAGGKAGIQLWQGSIAVSMDPKAQVFVPSDMPFGPYTIPGMSVEQIGEIIDCYAQAARRSALAGYDCVEFHGAHNYLPHSFLSAGLNHRTDEYGGSFENRARFPLECIRAIRENLPANMPILMRIDAHDDYLPGGLTIEDIIAFCKLAGEAGVDALDISRGNIITPASIYEVPPIDIERGFNVENAARIRRETGMITIAVGRINTAKQAEEILQAQKADFVVMGRAQLADPEFCNKAKEGREDDIVHCIGCNQGCYDGFCDVAHYPHITCLRNPMLGKETEYSFAPVGTPKKIAVIGGGPAGLEAAKILKMRGHEPVLFEKSDRLGGQFLTAGCAPGKEEMKLGVQSLARQVKEAGVEIHMQQEVTGELLRNLKPDQVIIAIGSEPIHLTLPGQGELPVYQAHDVLEGRKTPAGKVCIIGGGLVGLETADALAGAGCAVTVLEMKDNAGEDLGSLRKIAVLQKMAALKVEIMTKTRCDGLTKNGVMVEAEGEKKEIACDSVVMAVGAKARDSKELKAACEELGIPCEIVGDALQARRALQAIHEGFAAAMT